MSATQFGENSLIYRSEKKIVYIFPWLTKQWLRGPAPPGDLHSVPHCRKRIESRPDVQDGELVILVDFATVIVVDDISHFRPTTVDDPVMPVERQLVPGMRVCQ